MCASMKKIDGVSVNFTKIKKKKLCKKLSLYNKYITPVSQKNSGTVCKPDFLL